MADTDRSDTSCGTFIHNPRQSAAAFLCILGLLFAMGSPPAEAKPAKGGSSIELTPVINSITLQNGQLVASGTISATIKGKTYTSPFTVPVTLALAADQTGAGTCPILDLRIGAITLDLLGLVVETSPICLTLTAYDNGGLLGDLLCSVANLLSGGLSLDQILAGLSLVDPVTGTLLLPGLDLSQINSLLAGIGALLNNVLSGFNNLLGLLTHFDANRTCAILNLELGPIDLTLLGLNVHLDNCAGGPVTVDITAVTGKGKLLGNLLCELLDGGLLDLTTTLNTILTQILGLLAL
jgi:hypothetical protein